MGYRLLDHFYSFIFFEDEAVDHFVKRFVRDHVHYLHLLFCKAAIIVNALLDESQGGGYSAFHVRRGDLQYKEVKVNSSVLLANTLETHKIKEGQLIYIATDVKEREYFDDMKVAFPNVSTVALMLRWCIALMMELMVYFVCVLCSFGFCLTMRMMLA